MKVREVLKMLDRDGWYLDRTRGSHRQFKHPTKLQRQSVRTANENLLNEIYCQMRLIVSSAR